MEDNLKELNKIFQQIGEAITNKPDEYTIVLSPENKFEAFLMRIGLMKQEYKIQFRPLLVGNIYRISTRAVHFPDNIVTLMKEQGTQSVIIESIEKHIDDIIWCIACGIQNDKKEPSKRLQEVLRWELNMEQLSFLLDKVMVRLQYEDFIKSIILVRGLNLLKHKEQEEVTEPEMSL